MEALPEARASLEDPPRVELRLRRDRELAAARHPGDEDREVEAVADLTFGEYGRLLENPENWARLELDLDRRQFVAWLNNTHAVRKPGSGPRPSPRTTSPNWFRCSAPQYAWWTRTIRPISSPRSTALPSCSSRVCGARPSISDRFPSSEPERHRQRVERGPLGWPAFHT